MSQRRANSFSQAEIEIACRVLLTLLSGCDPGKVLVRDSSFQSLVSRFERMKTSFDAVSQP
jgi:hypothetical protein